MINYW